MTKQIITQKLNILLVESNQSARKQINTSINECCVNSKLRFAENMQDAITLSAVYYFDFILLESTIAVNINIHELKKLYLSRGFMPCIIILTCKNNRHHTELKHPAAGGSILKDELTTASLSKCLNGLLNLRIPGVIQQHGKTKLSGVILHQMATTDRNNLIGDKKKKTMDTNNPKESNNDQGKKNSDTSAKMVKVKPTLGPLNILIADDNDINRFIIEKMMKNWGVNMTLTADGRETLVKFSQEKFDVILLDLEMPGLNGYETARVIRNEIKNTEVPIIAMTGHIMQEEKEKCLKSGMNDIITKPFDQKTLWAILEKWKPAKNTIEKKQH